MKRLALRTSAIIMVVVLSACDFWPKDLNHLADKISEQVNGQTTAWLVGGDVVVISVEGSRVFAEPAQELETLATGIAQQAVDFVEKPLESLVITFYRQGMTEVPEDSREFIFLVMDGQPVLQPALDMDASGPLTLEELDSRFIGQMDPASAISTECLRSTSEKLAGQYGDPETLDPDTVAGISKESWQLLDPFSRRLILGQAIVSEAAFACVRPGGR